MYLEKLLGECNQLGNGPCWNVYMIYFENIIINGCKFVSKGVWNGDGWNPDSSKKEFFNGRVRFFL